MELSVSCACGRTMTLDALRGKGAYRCGCGARVKVTALPTRKRGCLEEGCNFAAASGMRLPFCAEHQKSLILELMPDVFRTYPPHKWYRLHEEYFEKFGRPPALPEWPFDRFTSVQPDTNHAPKVYFIVHGDRVKIGTTVNLRRRFGAMSLPPDAYIAATIPGSYDEERRMHNKFATERIGGSEWFERSARLDAFIEAAKQGKVA